MPTYEYTCSACGRSFEQRRAVSERHEPQACPECGCATATLRMSLPALVGARSDVAGGVCPSSGAPCGCAHALRH